MSANSVRCLAIIVVSASIPTGHAWKKSISSQTVPGVIHRATAAILSWAYTGTGARTERIGGVELNATPHLFSASILIFQV